MPRSAIVMVVAGAVLLAVLGVALHHYWPVLAVKSTLVKAIVIGLGVYGALLTAVMIRRIAEPALPMPLLAWLVAIAWFIMGAISTSRREVEDPHYRHHRNEPGRSSSFGKQGTGIGWAIFLTIVGLGMFAGSLGVTYSMAAPTLEAPVATTATTPASPPGTAEAKPPETIFDQPTLAKAIAFARPQLTDTRDAPSPGAKLLARYLAAKSTWADLAVANNETTLELVEKDPPAQIGKRLCIAGALAKIDAQTVDGLDLHAARISLATGDALEMYAVGKIGSLARRKPAKFCGVVTGRHDGGGAPATFAVGMFDTAR